VVFAISLTGFTKKRNSLTENRGTESDQQTNISPYPPGLFRELLAGSSPLIFPHENFESSPADRHFSSNRLNINNFQQLLTWAYLMQKFALTLNYKLFFPVTTLTAPQTI
jgi:hypothetical protein